MITTGSITTTNKERRAECPAPRSGGYFTR